MDNFFLDRNIDLHDKNKDHLYSTLMMHQNE